MNRIQELKKKLGTPDGVKKIWTAGGGTILVFDFEVGNEKVYFEAKYDNQKWSFHVAARIKKTIDFVNNVVLKGEICGINLSNCRKLASNNGVFLVENLADSEQSFDKIYELFLGCVNYMKSISEKPSNSNANIELQKIEISENTHKNVPSIQNEETLKEKKHSKEELLKIKEEELAKKEEELNLKLAKIAALEQEEERKKLEEETERKRKEVELIQLEDKKRKEAKLQTEKDRIKKDEKNVFKISFICKLNRKIKHVFGSFPPHNKGTIINGYFRYVTDAEKLSKNDCINILYSHCKIHWAASHYVALLDINGWEDVTAPNITEIELEGKESENKWFLSEKDKGKFWSY